MKNIFLLLGLFSASLSISQSIDISLENNAFTLLQNKEKTVMAASCLYGKYEAGIGKNLSLNSDNNGLFQKPEFLVLNDFLYKKAGDKVKLLSLYDEESQAAADKIINIGEAFEAYKNFNDFELLSKSEAGNFTRIRYNLIKSDGKKVPWVLMIKKKAGRYYLTELMSSGNIFIQIASAHPYNRNSASFESPDVKDLHLITFEFTNDSVSIVTNSIKNDCIKLYININKYKQNSDYEKEITLLNNMKLKLVQNDSKGFNSLWDPTITGEFFSSEYFLSQFEYQKNFYQNVSDMIPLAFIRSNDDLIVFYNSLLSDNRKVDQIIFMKIINGDYYLSRELPSYYAGKLINSTFILNWVFNMLK